MHFKNNNNPIQINKKRKKLSMVSRNLFHSYNYTLLVP